MKNSNKQPKLSQDSDYDEPSYEELGIEQDLYKMGYAAGKAAAEQNPLSATTPFPSHDQNDPYNSGFWDGVNAWECEQERKMELWRLRTQAREIFKERTL